MFVFDHGSFQANGVWNPPYETRLQQLRQAQLRIAYVSSLASNASFRYRVYNMVQSIKALGSPVSSAYFFESDILEHRYEFLEGIQRLVISGDSPTHTLTELILQAQSKGIPVFYDIEGLVFDEAQVPSILSLLRLPYTQEHLDHWMTSVNQHRSAMQLCNGFLAPQSYLAQKVERSTGRRCHVIPHFLNAQQLLASDSIFEQKVQAHFYNRDHTLHLGFFSESEFHPSDLLVASEAIAKLLRSDSRLRFRIGETLKLNHHFAGIQHRVERVTASDAMSRQREIGALEFHVAPMQNRPFNHCRSETSFLEAAICGSLTVASPVHDFHASIHHGVDGYLSPSHLWFETLEEAINHPKRRYVEMAFAAREQAYEHSHFALFGERILSALGMASDEIHAAQASLSEALPQLELSRFIPNASGLDSSASKLSKSKDLHQLTAADLLPAPEALQSVEFSVILATKDRKGQLEDSLKSLFEQTHLHFELIVIDDGSSDGTSEHLRERYASELASGKMILHTNPTNLGVCEARNIALSLATKPWIAYLDSDNWLRPHFLETFAREILRHPKTLTFYAGFREHLRKTSYWKAFDAKSLRFANYIDLGVFVHHRSLYETLGGFDPRLKRLVDWDLLLTYTTAHPPFAIDETLLDYNDTPDDSRITRSVSLYESHAIINAKHQLGKTTISTIVLFENHKDSIEMVLQSVLRQSFDVVHEVLVVDNASNDGSHEVIQKAQQHYGNAFTLLQLASPLNRAEIFQRSLAAVSGDFVAILEGQDCWTSNTKLAQQAHFLTTHPEASMVFSRGLLRQSSNLEISIVPGQEHLRKKLWDVQDFARDPTLKVSVSGCLFRGEILRSLPNALSETPLHGSALAHHLLPHAPIGFIPEIHFEQRAHSEDSRRPRKESTDDAALATVETLLQKRPVISTIVLAYQHKNFIRKALQSAIQQSGNIVHEILVADDGSTDGTREILQEFQSYCGHRLKLIGTEQNVGISENFKRCFAAASGDFIAVLEGDDHWTDPNKLLKQAQFLIEHPEASMVFSKIVLCDSQTQARSTLPRQDGLSKSLLTTQDFLDEPSMNLIANFSSCMFRAEIMKNLPETLFTYRFNEIALAMHLDTIGPIGFMPEPMSEYLVHPAGVWSGSSQQSQLESGLKVRQMALRHCAPQYRDTLQEIIRVKYEAPLRELLAANLN